MSTEESLRAKAKIVLRIAFASFEKTLTDAELDVALDWLTGLPCFLAGGRPDYFTLNSFAVVPHIKAYFRNVAVGADLVPKIRKAIQAAEDALREDGQLQEDAPPKEENG